MFGFSFHLRQFAAQPYVRPWALAVPVLVLLVGLPMLRPLRHPDEMSRDEELRLASISALVENLNHPGLPSRLCIDRENVTDKQHVIKFGNHRYSDQPPMLAMLLSGPYWILRRLGYTIEHGIFAPYLLTVLGVTLPVAGAGGIIYRMSRIFELPRPWRTLMAAAAVFASGLFSYATVLNEHAPAAVLVLASIGCLVHLAIAKTPARGGLWLTFSGFCAALAGAIDWPAFIFLPLFALIIPVMSRRWPLRIAGVLLYILGALPPIAVHCTATLPTTGDIWPGIMHPKLLVVPDRAAPPPAAAEEEDAAGSAWHGILTFAGTTVGLLLGAHGVFSHFPIVIIALFGMAAVMHRNWPFTTKMMAAVTLAAAIIIVAGYGSLHPPAAKAGFANRWFVLFLPLTVFWMAAWLRRRHRPITWGIAAALLAFSVGITLIGASEPMPRDGYSRWTPVALFQHKRHRLPSPVEPLTRIADDARK